MSRQASIPYRIRRSERARRIRVVVDGAGAVEVVLPRRASQQDADAAVVELREWIERRQAAVARAREERPRAAGTVPYLGEDLLLVPEYARKQVARRGERLYVPVDPAEQKAALERWYRRQARIEVAKRLDAATAQLGKPYNGLTIRAQKTRWASCSSSGAMNFNWRLLLAPAAVLDYVVWHEVCHLEIRDHSRRFWALLASWYPDYREQDAWLKRYSSTLHL